MRTSLFASVPVLSLVSLLASAPAWADEVAPTPAPAASVELPPRADGRAISVCGTQPLGDVARRVGAAVVDVEGSYAWSLGFAFGEPDLVVVPLGIAEAGRGILVSQRGRVLRATVAAIDEASELALLRVPGLEGVVPLEASPLQVELGTATVVPARPWASDGPADQLSTGEVTATEGQRFRSSSRVAYGFDAGAPVLDCSGRVLGANGWMADEAVRVAPVSRLVARARSGEAPYEGRWSFAHPSFHGLVELDGDLWGGMDLGLALVGQDRWEIGLSGRFLVHDELPVEQDGWRTHRYGVRGGADLRAGAKLMLTEGAMPLYAVPHVGVGFDVTSRGGERTRAVVTEGGCSSAEPCAVEGDGGQLPTRAEARLFPQVGLGVRVGFIELGYAFRLDVQDPARSGHQIGFGFQF